VRVTVWLAEITFGGLIRRDWLLRSRTRCIDVTGHQPLRLLCVASSLGVGGAEKLVADLLNGLDRSRVEPALVVLHGAEIMQSLKSDVRCTTGVYRWAGDPRGLKTLVGLMRDYRPDVVDVIVRKDAAVWGRIAARACRVPAVVHSDHHGAYRRAHELGWFAYHLANRPLDRWTDCFVEVSGAQRAFHIRMGLPESRMRIICNGVDAARYETGAEARGRALQALGISQDAQVIGCVGSLSANKNHRMLLQGVRRLVADHPRVKCVLVGEGPERAAIVRRVTEMGLEDVVLMLGQRRDVPDILPGLDVLAVVSKSESFSLVAVESMACGIPVVATDSGGPREIVVDDETGFLVPCGDSQSLSQRIGRLLDDPDKSSRMGAAGRKRVLSHFSLDSMIRRRTELYESLVAAKS
jgi:glycosyltransferase involved in cell wall biosynthesis